MVAFWIAFIWAIGTLAGVCAVFTSHNENNPEYYAISVFWPLFLVIFLLKGLVKAIYKSLTKWN